MFALARTNHPSMLALILVVCGTAATKAGDDQPRIFSAPPENNAPAGVLPGFPGFGLGFHLGYGYGGQALGVGCEGGYPCYGGPGYPHPAPCLRRLGSIVPFCYFGGPGYPTAAHPNFFGMPQTPLAGEEPVVTFERDANNPPYESGYGQFTGAPPYPESAFVPYSAPIGETAPPAAAPAPPAVVPSTTTDKVRDTLGLNVEAADRKVANSGLKVTAIASGSLAEKAGLRVNDVIESINGYYTTKPNDISWVIDKSASDKTLKMQVKNGDEKKPREVSMRIL